MLKDYILKSALFLSCLLASCSDNDGPGGEVREKTAIEFGKPFVSHVSRSADSISSNSDVGFESFNIYGYVRQSNSVIYEGEEVFRRNDGRWICERTEYWYPDQLYYFTAIAPANPRGLTYTPTSDGQTNVGDRISYDISQSNGNEDILYSSANVSTLRLYPPPPVELTFKHLLSQIKFTFHNELVNPHYFININWIQINGVPSNGDISPGDSSPTWNRIGNSTTWLPVGSVMVVHTGTPKESPSVCALPIYADGMSIMLKIQVFYTDTPYGGTGYPVTDENTIEVTFPSIDLKPGRAYNIICHLAPSNVEGDDETLEPISFTISGYDWMWEWYHTETI